MALKSIIYKADLQLADLDRCHFGDYSLTLARHPSETDERMMVRLLAFALNASETLSFGRGLSSEDEADLQDTDATGNIVHWIDVGLPDEKSIRRACHRVRQVMVLAYGGHAIDLWWQSVSHQLVLHKNLSVMALTGAASMALAKIAARRMQLQCAIQEGTVWLGDAQGNIEITPRILLAGNSNKVNI